jgi:hypothetical protein
VVRSLSYRTAQRPSNNLNKQRDTCGGPDDLPRIIGRHVLIRLASEGARALQRFAVKIAQTSLGPPQRLLCTRSDFPDLLGGLSGRRFEQRFGVVDDGQ